MDSPFLETTKEDFRKYKRLAEKALQQVKDTDLSRSIGSQDNSIAIVMCHIAGNLRSRFTDFLTTDGEKPWRKRDEEFEDAGLNRDGLMERWESGWTTLLNTLDQLAEADLQKEVRIRDKPLTVMEALTRSLSHLAYHVGQIVLLSRHFCGPQWQSLSIPKGKTEAYNRNPTNEK